MNTLPNFLCVGGDKYGCNLFANGSNGTIVDVETALLHTSIPLCWAGSHKQTLYKHCVEHNRKFYNLDTGYFGNIKRKQAIRVSVNGLQDQGPMIDRPGDRLNNFNLMISNFQRGSSIVIVPPDEKIRHVFNLKTSWIEDLQCEIKKYTDREVRLRTRPVARKNRLASDTFQDFIQQDTYLVIGYSSNALVEAVICGIPVISLGHSATKSYSNHDLADIENIPGIDTDKRLSWLKHLSYRQFTHQELGDGTAWKLLSD
jgi:hypothetical protein